MLRFTLPVTVHIEPGRVLAWKRPLGVQLCVRSGSAWVTQAGDPQDHFLRPGQTLALRPGSLAVMQAEQDVLLSFEAPGEQRLPTLAWLLVQAAARRAGATLLNMGANRLVEAHAGLP